MSLHVSTIADSESERVKTPKHYLKDICNSGPEVPVNALNKIIIFLVFFSLLA